MTGEVMHKGTAMTTVTTWLSAVCSFSRPDRAEDGWKLNPNTHLIKL